MNDINADYFYYLSNTTRSVSQFIYTHPPIMIVESSPACPQSSLLMRIIRNKKRRKSVGNYTYDNSSTGTSLMQLRIIRNN